MPPARAAFDRLGLVDSIVIDPHKHGLQPYGCGCVLFRDPGVGKFYKHDSPYTYFSSKDLHLGEISLECSRPGAAAVALWATQRLFPLVRDGEFAGMLDRCRTAALKLYDDLKMIDRFVPAFTPELDIVVWAVKAKTVSASSSAARDFFAESAQRGLHLALAELPAGWFWPASSSQVKAATVACLRSVTMKPSHAEWMTQLQTIAGIRT